ncbi:hypothetical protein [Pseudonocardia sp. KRD291]|uniref:hypothetical protein n=1 Tax=Pseudonocardia sp. KRD291 TaxID=2792007 RepID=UPI001C49FD0E|nr:hypothetical protein [Pseudonocardia sp. KRD291]MBW0101051.1 hypothetical protein [Pseudonocardia sp. KRD291]
MKVFELGWGPIGDAGVAATGVGGSIAITPELNRIDDMMDFVAADLEYSGQRMLPLQLGLVEVRAGVVSARHMLWFRVVGHPWPWVGISHQSTGLKRGPALDQEAYEGAPFLVDAWPSVDELVAGRLLVLHSAGLDMARLRAGFDAHGTSWPRLRYACTLQLARRVWPRSTTSRSYPWQAGGEHALLHLASRRFPEAGLFDGGRLLGGGHDPVEDAEAVAHVVLTAAQQVGAADLAELATRTGWQERTVEPDRYQTTKGGWIDRVPAPQGPPRGLAFHRAALQAAYEEIRREWRADQRILDEHRYPDLGEDP